MLLRRLLHLQLIATLLLALGWPVFAQAQTSDRVRTDLAWMHEQQLLTVSQVADVHIARITARGQDVAAGRTVVPGVKRPHA